MARIRPNLLDLPVEVFENILSYLNYETISKIRPVSKFINEICSSTLNSAFQQLQALMLQRFQKIKGQMPRRESARRKHPLARESDIIETLHMRLTLLQMSFGKHIERKHCCFFAGEILDEVFRIIRYVEITPSLARAYKVTDELFDLSTMAMEYFKERIEPSLPEITYFGSDFLELNSFTNSPGTSTTLSNVLNQAKSSDETSESSQSSITLKKLKRLRQDLKRQNKRQSSMLKELRRGRTQLLGQEKQINELTSRFEDFSKKNDGSSCKFNAVFQELNKCKNELNYWKAKSVNQLCCNCSASLLLIDESLSDANKTAGSSLFLSQKIETSELAKQTNHCEIQCDLLPEMQICFDDSKSLNTSNSFISEQISSSENKKRNLEESNESEPIKKLKAYVSDPSFNSDF